MDDLAAQSSAPPLTETSLWQSHRLLIALAAMVLVHAPTLLAYGGGLAQLEHYQFFPMMWIALALLVWARDSSFLVLRWYQIPLLLIDAILVVGGSLYNSPWLGFVGFCAGCLAVLTAGRDKTTGRSLWPLVLLPLVTLRPPLNLDTQVITKLQMWTARAASLFLERLDVLHYRKGVILQLPDRDLFVDEACSGIQSLFTLLGLAALIIVFHRRHWLEALLLLASATAWAFLLNVVRVVTIVLGDVWFDADLASGWQHTVLGYVLVGAALICLLSTDQLLLLCTLPILRNHGEEDKAHSAPRDENPLVWAFNRFFLPPLASTRPLPESSTKWPRSRAPMFLLAGVGSVFLFAQLISLPPTLRAGSGVVGTPAFGEDCLSTSYGDWLQGEYRTEQREVRSTWGEHSCQWDFTCGSQATQLSLDYLFSGWHELTDCYVNAGWQVTDRELRYPEGSPTDWPVVVVAMQDQLGVHGLVCYSMFDWEGRPKLPARDLIAGGVTNRWRRGTGRNESFQVQVFCTSLTAPSDEDIEQLVRFYGEARQDLARHVAVANSRGDNAE